MRLKLSSGPDEVIAIYLLLQSSFLFLFLAMGGLLSAVSFWGADTAGRNHV